MSLGSRGHAGVEGAATGERGTSTAVDASMGSRIPLAAVDAPMTGLSGAARSLPFRGPAGHPSGYSIESLVPTPRQPTW